MAEYRTYHRYPTLKSLRQTTIMLPVDKSGVPDWMAMQSFVDKVVKDAADGYMDECDRKIAAVKAIG